MEQTNLPIVEMLSRRLLILYFPLFIFMPGCARQVEFDRYQSFTEKSWDRFKKVKFGIPVNKEKQYYNLVFYTYLDPRFEYRTLDFNVIINSPSGEERIKDYLLPVQTDTFNLFTQCSSDSCIAKMYLKRSLFVAKKGVLTVEIENLIPRLKTEGIHGIGISLIPVNEH
jgi:gliding motility-associated lipoprotein GldH